jgi:hypothetical protein
MKKLNVLFIVLLALVTFSACKKEDDDAGKLPNIAFKTGTGYISADITLKKDTTITIGIQASKAEPNDVLKTFDASKSYDGATTASFDTETLTGSNGDNYSKDLSITTRNQAGTEKYTFTVVNRDGLKNQVSLTITVN